MENVEVNIKNWKSLIKPTKLDVQLNDDKSHAKKLLLNLLRKVTVKHLEIL